MTALAGRVYARANAAASRSGRSSGAKDLHTAVSLIGMSRLRELALTLRRGGKAYWTETRGHPPHPPAVYPTGRSSIPRVPRR